MPKPIFFLIEKFNHFCFTLLHLQVFCSLLLLLLNENGVQRPQKSSEKISCYLWNLQSFCVNLLFNTLELGEELFCCFICENMKADEGGIKNTKWGHKWQLKQSHWTGKWPTMNGRALREGGEETIIHRELGSKRENKWAHSKRGISLRNPPEWSSCRRAVNRDFVECEIVPN